MTDPDTTSIYAHIYIAFLLWFSSDAYSGFLFRLHDMVPHIATYGREQISLEI